MTVLLDKSGSMHYMVPAMKEAFNEFMEAQKGYRDQMFVSLYQFNSDGVETNFERLAVDAVGPLRMYTGGTTPLLDSVGATIQKVAARIEQAKLDHDAPDKVIFIVMTDGQENESTRWTKTQIQRLVAEKAQENWEFLFFGAGIDSFAESKAMGMSASDTANFDGSKKGIQSMWNMLNENLRGVRTGEKADMSMSDQQRAALK
jgi:Mg-chelatase subunit ChlD